MVERIAHEERPYLDSIFQISHIPPFFARSLSLTLVEQQSITGRAPKVAWRMRKWNRLRLAESRLSHEQYVSGVTTNRDARCGNNNQNIINLFPFSLSRPVNSPKSSNLSNSSILTIIHHVRRIPHHLYHRQLVVQTRGHAH